MKEACNFLNFPVVSGNVFFTMKQMEKGLTHSSYWRYGVVKNLSVFADQFFKRDDDHILIIGETDGHLTQSIYAHELLECDIGLPPRVDLNKELKNGLFVKELICKSLIDTVHDISDGGLLVAISEMSMKYNYGFDIKLKKRDLNSYLFGEDQARYVISVEKKI